MGSRPPTKFPLAIQVIKRSRFEPTEYKVLHGDDARSPDQPSTTTPAVDSPEPAPANPGQAQPAVSPDPSASTSTPSDSPLALSPPSDPSLPPDFNRHARRCIICSHPDRDAIEGDFIRWASPTRLARDYHIADRVSLYRHAHATGLFARRRREFARVLEDILECVEHTSLEKTSDVIIRAARVYAHLDENGQWFEPPRTHIILTGHAPTQSTANPELADSIEPRPRHELQEISSIPAKKRTYTCKSKQRLAAMTIRPGSPSRASKASRGTPEGLSPIARRKVMRGTKANKRLIATHPNSKNGPSS